MKTLISWERSSITSATTLCLVTIQIIKWRSDYNDLNSVLRLVYSASIHNRYGIRIKVCVCTAYRKQTLYKKDMVKPWRVKQTHK
jgi:hypothetical protein